MDEGEYLKPEHFYPAIIEHFYTVIDIFERTADYHSKVGGSRMRK